MTLAVVVLVLAAGFAARTLSVRLARTTSDLFTAIRPASPPLVGAGLAAEHLGGPGVAALLLVAASGGPRGAWLGVALATGLVALISVAAGQLRRAGTGTPGDLAAAIWSDQRLTRSVHLATLVALALHLVPVIQVAARTIGAAMPLPYPIGAVMAGGLLAIAVLTFRGRGSLYAQPVRLVALAAGLASAAVLVSTDRTIPSLGLSDAGGPEHLPGLTPALAPVLAGVSYSVAVVVGTIAAPQLWPRLQAARDPSAARRAVTAATLLVALLALATLAIGSRLPTTTTPDGAGAGEATGVGGRLLLGLFLGGLLSGCFAGGSALLTSAATVARRLRWGAAPAVAGTAAAATLLAVAWRATDLVTVVGWGFAYTAAALTPVVATGLWWRPAPARATRWGLVTGAVLTVAAVAATSAGFAPAPSFGAPGLDERWWARLAATPALVCVPAAFAATVIGSLGTTSPPVTTAHLQARLGFHRPRGHSSGGGL